MKNSSNMLVIEGDKKVYGLDFGWHMTEKQLTSQASRSVKGGTSFKRAFSKISNKNVLLYVLRINFIVGSVNQFNTFSADHTCRNLESSIPKKIPYLHHFSHLCYVSR